jgi:hypothetical protein
MVTSSHRGRSPFGNRELEKSRLRYQILIWLSGYLIDFSCFFTRRKFPKIILIPKKIAVDGKLSIRGASEKGMKQMIHEKTIISGGKRKLE